MLQQLGQRALSELAVMYIYEVLLDNVMNKILAYLRFLCLPIL